MEALLLVHVQLGARVRTAFSSQSGVMIRGRIMGFIPDPCCGFFPAVIYEDDGGIEFVCQRWLVPDAPMH